MKPPAVAVLVALALTSCGGVDREDSGPAAASDPQRTQDLVPLTPAQAAHRADRIALVRAGGSRVVEGAPGTPFTRTAFTVERVVKGRLPQRFVLQVIGGRLGDHVVRSPVPAFSPARRYVLFLGPDGPVGPTIFPQAVLAVDGGAVPALDGRPSLAAVLTSLRRSGR